MHVSHCVCMYTYVLAPMEARKLAPLELEFYGIVGHLMWVLGPKLRSSVRAVCALDCSAISPDTQLYYCQLLYCPPTYQVLIHEEKSSCVIWCILGIFGSAFQFLIQMNHPYIE